MHTNFGQHHRLGNVGGSGSSAPQSGMHFSIPGVLPYPPQSGIMPLGPPGMLPPHNVIAMLGSVPQQSSNLPPILPEYIRPQGIMPSPIIPSNSSDALPISTSVENNTSLVATQSRSPAMASLIDSTAHDGASGRPEKSDEACKESANRVVVGAGKATPPSVNSVWTEHKTKDGRIFWHNSMSSKSSWDKPDELKTEEEKILSSQTAWKEYTSADGRTYWYNKETKQSVWNMPEQVKKLKEQTEEKWPIFEEKEEAVEKLKVLFEQRGVGVKTKWDEAFKLIHQDQRYGCFSILATGEKKQVLTEYITQLQRRAREEERANRIKARETMVEVLAKWEDLKVTSRYRDFAESHYREWWWNHIDERERDDIFQDFMDEHEQKDRGERRQKRQEQIENLIEGFGKVPGVKYNTPWKDVEELIQDHQLCKDTDKLDILAAWESFVHDAEKVEIEKRKRRTYRLQRKRRDDLRTFYAEAVAAGGITAKTNWAEFMKEYELKHEAVYLDVLGQSGSSPRDLFEEVVEALTEEYERQKSVIKKLIRSAGIQITPDTTFEWFYDSLRPQEDFANVSEQNARVAFDHLRRKAVKQAKRKDRTATSSHHRSRSRSRSYKRKGGSRRSGSRKRHSRSKEKDSADVHLSVVGEYRNRNSAGTSNRRRSGRYDENSRTISVLDREDEGSYTGMRGFSPHSRSSGVSGAQRANEAHSRRSRDDGRLCSGGDQRDGHEENDVVFSGESSAGRKEKGAVPISRYVAAERRRSDSRDTQKDGQHNSNRQRDASRRESSSSSHDATTVSTLERRSSRGKERERGGDRETVVGGSKRKEESRDVSRSCGDADCVEVEGGSDRETIKSKNVKSGEHKSRRRGAQASTNDRCSNSPQHREVKRVKVATGHEESKELKGTLRVPADKADELKGTLRVPNNNKADDVHWSRKSPSLPALG